MYNRRCGAPCSRAASHSPGSTRRRRGRRGAKLRRARGMMGARRRGSWGRREDRDAASGPVSEALGRLVQGLRLFSSPNWRGECDPARRRQAHRPVGFGGRRIGCRRAAQHCQDARRPCLANARRTFDAGYSAPSAPLQLGLLRLQGRCHLVGFARAQQALASFISCSL